MEKKKTNKVKQQAKKDAKKKYGGIPKVAYKKKQEKTNTKKGTIKSLTNDIYKKAKKFTTNMVIPTAIKTYDNVTEYTKENVVPTVKKVASTTKQITEEKVIPTAKKAAIVAKDKTKEVIDYAKSNITEEQISNTLDKLYTQSVNGIPKVSLPIDDLVEDYLSKNDSLDKAAKSIITNSTIKCGTSGFITNLGSVLSMLLTLPANITSVMYVQLRMCCAIAKMSGFDITTDQVQTMIYACLTGSAMSDVLKQAGVKFTNKFTAAMINKIPGAVLTKINQKVGFRFVTKAGEKGIINLANAVPVVGGLIGGGVDVVSTQIIGNNAYNLFVKGKVVSKKEIEKTIKDIPIDVDSKVVEDIDTKTITKTKKTSNNKKGTKKSK